jgi:hypothetical protein
VRPCDPACAEVSLVHPLSSAFGPPSRPLSALAAPQRPPPRTWSAIRADSDRKRHARWRGADERRFLYQDWRSMHPSRSADRLAAIRAPCPSPAMRSTSRRSRQCDGDRQETHAWNRWVPGGVCFWGSRMAREASSVRLGMLSNRSQGGWSAYRRIHEALPPSPCEPHCSCGLATSL